MLSLAYRNSKIFNKMLREYLGMVFLGSEYQINRLMDPESVKDFWLRVDDY